MEPATLFLGYIILIAIIFCYELHCRSYRKQINSLNNSIRDMEKKLSNSEIKRNALLKEIELLKWQIANPPKYKKGDKIGELIINSYEVYNPEWIDFVLRTAKSFFRSMFGIEKETSKDPSLTRQYIYHLTHTVSGEKVQKRELELIELSKTS